jgi:putative peptidoglycan lipid II flippase
LPGWPVFGAKVLLASLLLTGFLAWASISFDWLAMRQQVWGRLGTMALVLIGSALLYFACLRLSGLRLQSLLRR